MIRIYAFSAGVLWDGKKIPVFTRGFFFRKAYVRQTSKCDVWIGFRGTWPRYFFPPYSSINIDWFVEMRPWESLRHLLLSHLPTPPSSEIRWKRFSNERCSHSWYVICLKVKSCFQSPPRVPSYILVTYTHVRMG